MRQLTVTAPFRLEWIDVPEPRIEAAGQALIRPIAAATCDIDLPLIAGAFPFEEPFALGHETVAEVVEVGEAVRSVAVGDRVVVPFQISCGDCGPCGRGRTGNCASVPKRSGYGLGTIGGLQWGGTLSDLVLVPFADAMLVPLPDGVEPAAVASGSDNLPDAWRTVGPPLESEPGAHVLVCGGAAAGSIGLYAVGMAVGLGAERVDYLDQDANRLAIAERLGASCVEGPFPKRVEPHPVTVDASANPAGLSCAIRSTEPGGTCTSTGIYFSNEVPTPLLAMYDAGITFVTGRPNARANIPGVLDLVASGRFDPTGVTTRTVSWDEAPQALVESTVKLVMARA